MAKLQVSMLHILLPIFFTIILFLFLLWQFDHLAVYESIKYADKTILILVVLLSFVIMIIRAERWRSILQNIGLKISLWESFRLSMASLPFWLIAPSTSGDLVKSIFLKARIRMAKTVGSVACENLFDLSWLLLFSLFGLFFFFDLYLFILIVVSLLVVIFIFISSMLDIKLNFLQKISLFKNVDLVSKIHDLMGSTKIVMSKPWLFSYIFALTFISWLISMVQVYLIFMSLSLDIPLLFSFANIPIAILIGMVPVVMGGMGTRDAAIVFLFASYAGSGALLGAGIIFTIVRYIILALVGSLFLWDAFRKETQ